MRMNNMIKPEGRKMMGRILCKYRLIDIDLFFQRDKGRGTGDKGKQPLKIFIKWLIFLFIIHNIIFNNFLSLVPCAFSLFS